MSLYPTIKKDEIMFSKFIDWDKFENCFYNNIYLEDYKIVVKMPLIPRKNSKKDIKIKKFDLTKYTYLVSYD
ncbi:MAG: hypothetical protein ACXACC_01700 [Promethearchaeota archaeon]|jgi:hypothetical protein